MSRNETRVRREREEDRIEFYHRIDFIGTRKKFDRNLLYKLPIYRV